MSICVFDPDAGKLQTSGTGQDFAYFLFRRSGCVTKRRMTSGKMGHTNRLIGPDNTG